MTDRVESPAPGHGRASARGGDRDVETLKVCHAQATRFLDQLHGKILAAVDESITQLSDHAAPREEGLRLLEDLRLLRSSGEKLQRALQEHFTQYYRDDTGPGPSPPRRAWLAAEASGESGFSLVDDQQLDEWLAIDRLIGKIGDTHGDELQGLTLRFQHLLPGREDVGCPLGPDRVCHTFHDALVSLEVDPGMRVRCYELLYRILLPEIGAFYAETNQLLINRGVLPQIRIEAVTQSTRARPERQRQAAAKAEAIWSDAIEPDAGSQAEEPLVHRRPTPLHEQMFQAMQHLLRAHFREDGTAGTAAGFNDAGPIAALPITPMLIDTLSVLQHDDGLIEHAGELIRGGLKQQVADRFSVDGNSAGSGLNQIDDETIEVISMIFDYILDDRALPDFMKALIARLQIPVLKVAIIDREFFSRKSHPARQLLNELSHAGLGWSEESEAAKDRLYQKMESTVRRILNEFESDTAIFGELLVDFRKFLDDEARSYGEAQTRLLEAAQQNERQERIKLQIAAEFAQRLSDRDLPADIREFLLTPWRTYATTVVLENGEESAAAKAALAFIDDLLWSLEPKPEPDDRKRLVRMLPALLESLREGLRRIACPDDDVERIILSLQELHFECMKSGRRPAEPAQAAPATMRSPADPAPTPAPPTVVSDSAADEVDRMFTEISRDLDDLSSLDWDHLSNFDDVREPKSEAHQHAFDQMIAEMGIELERDEGPRIDDEYTDQVRALELGTWIELIGDSDETLRGKLAWKGDEYSSYSFVNRQYKVVAERPLYMLAEDFRSGKASVIEDIALFDRAMDGVISGIMRFAGAAGR